MALRYLADRDRWEAAISNHGKRLRKTFKKKSDAIEFLKNSEFVGVRSRSTIADMFASSLEIDSKRKIAKSEKDDRRAFQIFQFYFEKVRGLKMASEIGLEDLEYFLLWGRDAHECGNVSKASWSESTLARHAILLKTVLKKATHRERIPKNPATLWKVQSVDSKLRRGMTREEFDRLCLISPAWFIEVIRFQRLTAARGASVATLTWADVDFETGVVYLRSRKGGRNREKKTPIPMYPGLRRHMESQPRGLRDEPVFMDESGHPLTAAKISRVGHRMIKKAGLEGVVLYSLRHAMARDLTEAGVPTNQVQQIMGHADIRTTQNYTRELDQKVLAESVSRIRGEVESLNPAAALIDEKKKPE